MTLADNRGVEIQHRHDNKSYVIVSSNQRETCISCKHYRRQTFLLM